MAEWDSAYVNNLPDSAFACIAGGGTKEGGKTTPRSLRKYPHHDAAGRLDVPHLNNALARVAQEATTSCGRQHLMDHRQSLQGESAAPPRVLELVRGRFDADAAALRAAPHDALPTLFGHFAVFDTWTEIDSAVEGRFMERIAPGAFAKTFAQNRDQIRVLFQHGRDPVIGDKPIAAITELTEDEVGARYEASLLDGLPPLLLDGLRKRQYGASFRFRVMREDVARKAAASDHNPDALPERTIKEASVAEFGPVTWGAYESATAGLRSMTDEWLVARLAREPDRLAALLGQLQSGATAPTTDGAGSFHPVVVRREVATPRRFTSDKEWDAWISLT